MHSTLDESSAGSGAPTPGTRFYRFLRYSHILSYTLREILEDKVLRQSGPHPLTRAQFCFLKLIAHNADLQIGEVAHCLGVSPAASSKNVDKLESLGLVERTDSVEDRRARLLVATEKGRHLLQEYESLKASYIAPVIDRLGEEEIDHLCCLLERVCTGLVEEEQPVSGRCLRCSGYYEKNCAIGLIQGGCALEECEARASGRSSGEAS
jgi:DNA-binding MarR family transcriptional regulator